MKKTRNRKLKTVPLCTWRYYTMIAVVCLCFFSLVGRAAYLQVVNSNHLAKAGDSRSVRIKGISSHRGLILDRNGEELARSVPIESIWLDPKTLLENKGVLNSKSWKAFIAALNKDEKAINAWLMERANKRFVWLERHLDPNVAQYVKRLAIKGVNLKSEYRRYYPSAEVAANLVGFTGVDDKGIEGIEKAFDSYLTGQPGKEKVVVDLYRRVVEERGVLAEAEQGNDLQLSIDSRIQSIAYKELKKAVLSHNAKGGSVVVVDVDSGEVLAMASQPSFNPNRSDSRFPAMTRNRAISDLFEPGSTVKPLTVVSALESGKYQPNSTVDTSPGRMYLNSRPVRDHRNYGVLDLAGIIKKSSNMGVSKLALSLSDQEFLDSFHKVGFGKITGLGVQGEAKGVMRPRDNWSDIEKATFSFGYGFQVSAIQLAQAYSVLGADGVKRPLTILKQSGLEQGEQVIKPKIAKDVVRMMENVVATGGTGTRAKVEGFRVAGKTGTSRKVARTGGYGDEYVTVFAGLVPATDPKLAIVVMVDEPAGDSYYGGTVSAPVFSKVANKALDLMNVAPDQMNSLAVGGVLHD
ncbi:penicillin-binding protein 2 [Kangiella sp. TOML190]|uniref:peptidoglycan D,D-transpeptidase FtsI family protein n=1 Tax=Kangiella sp. TOML190 TaxID=2931351 RepID=UPI0020417AED|nr:penicillin-binding transpeptidase domain-containing protein [Kangiella sp. TOML190]